MRLRVALPAGFRRDSAHQYGLMAGLALVEFLYTALLARKLGTNDFGLVVVFLGAARICQGVTDLRVHELVIRFVENARVSGSSRRLTAALAQSLRLDLGSTFAGLALAVAITIVVPAIIPGAPQHRGLMLLAIVSVTAGWAGRFWSVGVLRLFHRVDRQVPIQLGGSAAKLVVTAIWFRAVATSPAGALAIAALCSGMAGALLLWTAARIGRAEAAKLGSEEGASASPLSGRRHYVAYNYGIGLLETAYRELDVQLIGWFGSLEQVSIYKLGKTMAGVIVQAVDPVVLLLLPQFARHVAEERLDALRVFIRQVASGFAAVGLLLGVCAHVAITWVIPLVAGHAYIAAAGPFRVIVWCLVVAMPFLWAHALCMALGRPQLYFSASIAGVAVLVAMVATLVPVFGATGAAWAFGVSQIVVNVVALVLLIADRRTPRDILFEKAIR